MKTFSQGFFTVSEIWFIIIMAGTMMAPRQMWGYTDRHRAEEVAEIHRQQDEKVTLGLA